MIEVRNLSIFDESDDFCDSRLMASGKSLVFSKVVLASSHNDRQKRNSSS